MLPKPLRDVLLLELLELVELVLDLLCSELVVALLREASDDTGVPLGRSTVSMAFGLGFGMPLP